MKKSIYLVGGSKGGVGKSTVAMALLDYLTESGETPLLIETDTSNPDVAKAYGKTVATKSIDLDKGDGWVDFLNSADAHDGPIVVNGAARNNTGISTYGGNLGNSLVDLDRALVTLWVVNRQRDGLELLKQYLEALPQSKQHTVHIVRNTYYGTPEQFELLAGSKIKTSIEDAGGKTLSFPNLADRITDEINNKRLSIAEAAKSAPIGNRAEINRWRTIAKEMFVEVVK